VDIREEKVLQYVIAFVLCVVVGFAYSSTRKDTPVGILRDGLVVLAWMLGALVVLGAFGYVGSHFL